MRTDFFLSSSLTLFLFSSCSFQSALLLYSTVLPAFGLHVYGSVRCFIHFCSVSLWLCSIVRLLSSPKPLYVYQFLLLYHSYTRGRTHKRVTYTKIEYTWNCKKADWRLTMKYSISMPWFCVVHLGRHQVTSIGNSYTQRIPWCSWEATKP